MSLHFVSTVWRSGENCIPSVHFCVCLLPLSLVKQKACLLPNSASPGVRPQLQRQRDYGSELIPLLICIHFPPTPSIYSQSLPSCLTMSFLFLPAFLWTFVRILLYRTFFLINSNKHNVNVMLQSDVIISTSCLAFHITVSLYVDVKCYCSSAL